MEPVSVQKAGQAIFAIYRSVIRAVAAIPHVLRRTPAPVMSDGRARCAIRALTTITVRAVISARIAEITAPAATALKATVHASVWMAGQGRPALNRYAIPPAIHTRHAFHRTPAPVMRDTTGTVIPVRKTANVMRRMIGLRAHWRKAAQETTVLASQRSAKS